MNARLKYAKIFLMGVAITSLISCDSFFNPEVPTVLAEQDNFTDYLSSRSSVNGLYALMQDVMDSYVVNGELKADMITTTPDANEDLRNIYSMDYSLPNKYLDVLPFYTIIANANDVIYHLENNLASGSSYEEELVNMHAEAVILRSWVYFYLLRNYQNVPYISLDYTASGATVSIEEWLAENASTTVQLDELIAATEAVIEGLIPDYYTESAFFNIASANAFLGEMYLWKDDYQGAVDALLVSAHAADDYRFILDLDLEKAKWANIFKGDESAADEMMLKIIFDIGQKQENELLDLFSSIGPDPIQLLPAPSAIAALNGDTYRFNGTFKSGGEIGKYTRSLDNPYTSDMPVILYRAADVHLMLAEAYNRLGRMDIALDLVNSGNDSLFTQFSKGVRGRVSLPSISVSGDTPEEKMLDLEDKILAERSRELAFEGKRWYDLVRISSRRDDPGFLVEKMQNKYPESDSAAVASFYGNSENYYINLD